MPSWRVCVEGPRRLLDVLGRSGRRVRIGLTPLIFSDTFLVPCAANCVVRVISWVAAPCCFTAAAIAVATSLTSPMMPPMLLMASMASPATFWMSGDLLGDLLGRLGGLARQRLHFGGDDRKPRPASPARAASMVALSASRLVCAAMVLIRPTTSPIRPADWARPWTVPSVSRASADRAAGDAGGVRCLPADVVDRGAQLLGSRGHGLDVH